MNIIEIIKGWFSNLHLDLRPVRTQKQIECMFPKLSKGFHAGDANYNTTSLESMHEFLKTWQLKHKTWTKKFDCDNFSDVLMGWAKLTNPTQAIGTVWVKTGPKSAHAINFFVYWENKIFNLAYIEPQTGEILKLTNRKVLHWKPYYVRI